MASRTLGLQEFTALTTRPSPPQTTQEARQLMAGVYGSMGAALVVTGGVSLTVALRLEAFQAVFAHPSLLLCMMVVQLGMAVAFQSVLKRAPVGLCMLMMAAYAAVDGLTLSWLMLNRNPISVAVALLCCSLAYLCTSLYCAISEEDAGGARGLWCLVLSGTALSAALCWMLQSYPVSFGMCLCGLGTFAMLSAFESARIKQEFTPVLVGGEPVRAGVAGALMLYLDFVTVFVNLLKMVGFKKKEP